MKGLIMHNTDEYKRKAKLLVDNDHRILDTRPSYYVLLIPLAVFVILWLIS